MPLYKQKTTLDASGNVLGREEEELIRRKVQPFYQVFLPTASLLHQLAGYKDLRVLLALAELAEFNTNTVILLASRRLQVMQQAQVSTSQLSSCIRRMKNQGLLSGGKNEATIHPAVLWKGDKAHRKELLEKLRERVQSEFSQE